MIGVCLAGLAFFALLNWSTFSRPTTLNVVVASVDAPLGVILLIAIGVLTLIYAVSLARLKVATLIEVRRMTKDRDHVRRIADQTEESRIQELQDFLKRELPRMDVKLEALLDAARQQTASTHISH
jgi:divalent metal cation (Fe/Co/Zn/Cd) transporter